MTVVDFFKFLLKLSGYGNQLDRYIQELKNECDDLRKNIIPFTSEEFELLSLNINKPIKKGSFSKITKGILDTIYYEPLLIYASTQVGPSEKILYIEASTESWIYHIENNKTKVWFNGDPIGYISHHHQFLTLDRRVLAVLEKNLSNKSYNVLVKGNHVCKLNNPLDENKISNRNLQMLHEVDQSEMASVIALVLPYIVHFRSPVFHHL